MRNEINLLHNRPATPFGALMTKIAMLRGIGFMILFATTMLSVLFFFLVLFSPFPAVKQLESKEIASLRLLYPKMAKLERIKERTKAIEIVLSGRQYLNQIIDEVVKELPNGTSVEQMKVDTKEVRMMITSSSLRDTEIFLQNLTNKNNEKKIFSKITVTSLTSNEKTGKYSLDLYAIL